MKKAVTESGTTFTTLYRMAGDLLLSEKTGAETIWYEYDSGANLISMKLNGTRYFYIRNLQNDIVGLTDPSGNVVVRYEYNAWGKLLNITGSLAGTVGVKNPFRYRGYYYDTETGLYYLKSRYYDPGVGETIKGLRVSSKIAEGTSDAIDTYSSLRKINKGTGKEVHHIIEKRFAKSLDLGNPNQMLSIALDKKIHRIYTNAWRKALPYRQIHNKTEVIKAAARIYSETPRLMGVVLFTLMIW